MLNITIVNLPQYHPMYQTFHKSTHLITYFHSSYLNPYSYFRQWLFRPSHVSVSKSKKMV